MNNNLQEVIEKAWSERSLLLNISTRDAVCEVIELLDKGKLRIAEPEGNTWKVNEWIKKAVIMYFPINEMKTIQVGPLEFHD